MFEQYSYYTLTALGISVPKFLKQGLTVIQITQLVFSDLLAALYLFVSYDAVEYQHITASQQRMEGVACIDTSGQAFAIWLSVLYLTPLIVLFVRFFINSYSRGTSRGTGRHENICGHKPVSGPVNKLYSPLSSTN